MKTTKKEYVQYKVPLKFEEGEVVTVKSGKNKGETATIKELLTSMIEGPKYHLSFEDPNLDGWFKEEVLEVYDE